MVSDSPSSSDAPPAKSWPAGGLEVVATCPVCGEGERELAHAGVRDRVFACAPGEWNLYRCLACGSGFLDPRPTVATIGLAYASYFTHASAEGVGQPPRSAWRRYRVAQRNAYLNLNYGYRLTPAASRIPRWLSTERRQRWEKHCGYLRFAGPGARLLDIGCGNGRFLLQMRALGWDVSGVEPDAKSAAAAVAAGLKVRVGPLQTGLLPDAHFDAVTLNHVIEHLHDPIAVLRMALRSLKPGGALSVATPNFEAAGHRLFGPDWFPLDPPRHLVLFTPASLRRVLVRAGFEPEGTLRLRLDARGIFTHCVRLAAGGSHPSSKASLVSTSWLRTRWLARKADRQTRENPGLAEELVLLARRPAATAA